MSNQREEARFWKQVESLQSLSPHITIETLNDGKSVEDRERVHQEMLGLLNDLYNELRTYLPQKITSLKAPPNSRHLGPKVMIQYRQVKFLDDKIFRMRAKMQRNACEQLECVMHLIEHLVPKQYILYVDMEAFKDAILTETPKLTAVKEKLPVLYREFKQAIAPSPSPDQQQRLLHGLIEQVIGAKDQTAMDTETLFFPPHPRQCDFENLLFMPNFCCERKMTQLINSFSVTKPQDFLTKIIEFAELLASTFGVKDNLGFSVVVTMLIRTIFDEVYEHVDVFDVKVAYIDILAELRSLKVKDLAPPLEYCPPMDDDSNPGVVFRNDPHFAKAIQQIENTAFFTNPLDILNCIHLAFKEIEKGAAFFQRDSCETHAMLPFDVTFGLFLCCILGSDMPEYIRIAEFTKLYAPPFGLCPAFEFALTKIKATTAHLTRLCQAKVDAEKEPVTHD